MRITIGISLSFAAVVLLGSARVSAQLVTQLSAGDSHSCARLLDGTARGWGLNAQGQLGNGTTLSSPFAVQVNGLAGVVAVSAGDEHTCALLTNGTARCWGANFDGQLGDGTTTQRSTPVPVTGLSNATALAASGSHTCALLATGSVRCWGLNADGQLGDGTELARQAPVSVLGLSTVARCSRPEVCAAGASTDSAPSAMARRRVDSPR